MSTVEMGMMAKETKVRKRTKRKWNRTVGILLYVTAMVVIVTLAAFYQRTPQPPPKKPVDDYFSFSDGFATVTYQSPDNNTIKINTLSFDMNATGGNATEVHIYVWGGSVPEEEMPYFPGPIIQGQTVSVGPIMYSYDMVIYKEDGKGWGPLNFTLSCDEAEGNFSIYVTEFLPSPGF